MQRSCTRRPIDVVQPALHVSHAVAGTQSPVQVGLAHRHFVAGEADGVGISCTGGRGADGSLTAATAAGVPLSGQLVLAAGLHEPSHVAPSCSAVVTGTLVVVQRAWAAFVTSVTGLSVAKRQLRTGRTLLWSGRRPPPHGGAFAGLGLTARLKLVTKPGRMRCALESRDYARVSERRVLVLS
jgi:hypothetical protein